MTTTSAQPTKRLTERQQLALALAESTRDCPVDALIANKVSPSSSSSESDGETDDDNDQRDQQSEDQDMEEKEQNDEKKNKKKNTTTRKLSPKNAKHPQQLQVPMSRQQKELAKLAPWAWDPLVSRHAPGPSALRDFSEVLPSSGVKHKPRATMMTPTAARPALKATFGSLTGSAKNKKAEKEKENVVPSPPLLKNIVASSTNNDAAKKSSNTANTKAVSGGAKRKTAAAENTPKTPAVDAVATKKVRKNAASNAEKVAAATKKEEEKIEKEKEIPATAIATKKRSTIAASRGKKGGAVATEEPKTAPQKRTQKSEQITPVAFELEPASGAESNKKSGEKNLKRSAVNAAGATTDTVVPATAAKGARGKKAAVIIDTPVVTAKKKLNLQTPGATTVENNNNDNKRKAVVAEREAAGTAAKSLNPSTKKRKKDSGVDTTAVGTKDSKLDPSKLVPPEFQQRQLTPEERKERRDKFWVFLETIKVRPPKESSVLVKEAIPLHKLYQSFCFATGRIAREAFNPTDAAATRKQGFAKVTLSSSRQYEDEDEGAASLARRVRLVPMSQSLRIAVRALK